MTRATLDLLARHGIRYDSFSMDDDKPYRLATASETIAVLPVHSSLDDWEQYAFLPDRDIGQQIESPHKVIELGCSELDDFARD